MSEPTVDVLAVLREYARDTGPFRVTKQGATNLAAACAAVTELIGAQRKAHDAMLLADWNVPALCSERQHAAYLASVAALAQFGDTR